MSTSKKDDRTPEQAASHPEQSTPEESTGGTTRRDFLKVAGVGLAGGVFALNAPASLAAEAVKAATGAGTAGIGKAKPAVLQGAPIKPRVQIAKGRVIGANDRINIVHIGVGGQGGAHVAVSGDHHAENNTQSIGVSDVWTPRIDRAKAAILQRDDTAKVITERDYRRLLDNKDVDAVIVATPEHWHAQVAVDAMNAGKHVYCEKPMTRYMDEALAIYDTQKRTGKAFQIGSQYCSEAKWHVAGQTVTSGKIGAIVSSQGSYTRNSKDGEWNYGIDPSANPDNLDWKMWLGTAPDRPWNDDSRARFFRYRKYRDYSAGLLGDLMPHKLHPLMIALFGDKPEWPLRVTTLATRKISTDREVADHAEVMVEFPAGHTMYILLSTVNEQGIEDMIRGHEATLRFGGQNVQLRPERPFAEDIDAADIPVNGPGPDLGVHQKDWLDSIRTGKKPNGDIDLATKVQAIVCMAEASELNHKTASWDPAKRKIII